MVVPGTGPVRVETLTSWSRIAQSLPRIGHRAEPVYAADVGEWSRMFRTGVDPGERPDPDLPRRLVESLGMGPTAMDHDVTGSSVDPGEYVLGTPECMLTEAPEPTPVRSVRIGLDTGVTGGVPAGSLVRTVSGIVSAVSAMETMGWTVSVDVLDITDALDDLGRPLGIWCLHIPVKRPDAVLNPRRLAWACGHPNMNRDTVFAWLADVTGCPDGQWRILVAHGGRSSEGVIRAVLGPDTVPVTLMSLVRMEDPARGLAMMCMGVGR